jgi:hypothetical protein
MIEVPKIFVSYSWTSPSHEEWVINLAERLVSDGVDVIIDKWTLKEGQDKYHFMESMVKSDDIKKVLLILDKKYAEKAELRSGGVGTETQIISPSVYANIAQQKFIPLVTEKNDAGIAYVPTYLEGRIYIDFSEDERFEESYENLLRNIFERPAYSKPKIGKAPSYLFEETLMTHKTSSLLRSFENQITKNPKRVNAILRDFFAEFFANLKEYKITFPSRVILEIGKALYDNINSYTPLRNDYIYFIDKLLKSEIEFDIEIIIRFLEKLPSLKSPQDDRSSWSSIEFDNFKFFIHELFLYTIAVGLKNEKYKFIEELLYASYFFNDKYDNSNEPKTFQSFYQHIDIIKEYYNSVYSQNFYSPMADFMIKRIPDNFTKDDLIDADLLIYYVGVLNNVRWFPITYIYKTAEKFTLFDRMISLRHFDKVKVLFDVSTPSEFKTKINHYKETNKNSNWVGYSGSFEQVLPIYKLVDMEKIGTTR